MIRGKDWIVDEKGNWIVNYGGFREEKWEPWQQKFCWYPRRIVLKAYEPYEYSYSKLIWLKTIFVRRRRIKFFPTVSPVDFEYEYAEDLFDLIKQESNEKI